MCAHVRAARKYAGPLRLSAVSQSLGRSPALFACALEEEKAEEDKVGGWGKSGWKRGGKAGNGQKKIVNIGTMVAAQRNWKRIEAGAKVSWCWHFDRAKLFLQGQDV